jgi:FkbM family methyltransferase
MHDGSDTAYYLHQGYKVIAIEANPDLVAAAAQRFRKYIDTAQLVLLDVAITDHEGPVIFNISKEDVLSSINKEFANRDGKFLKQVEVPGKRLDTLFTRYGIPEYCKIDIEGYDAVALQTIDPANTPHYISVECEAAGEDRAATEEETLQTLELLYTLGYTQFKLVDQDTMHPLKPDEQFYFDVSVNMSLPARAFRFLKRNTGWRKKRTYFDELSEKYSFVFKRGSAGPWGEDVEGVWYNYEQAKHMLLRHKRDYMAQRNAFNFGFWCDWHAKKQASPLL